MLSMDACTVCASTASSLRVDRLKDCARCKTPYCSQDCQTAHWNGGHKKKCKKIAKAGGRPARGNGVAREAPLQKVRG